MSKIKKRKITVTKKEFLSNNYFRNGDWHWSYNTILIGIFGGIFSIFFVANRTLIYWDDLAKLYLFMALVPLLVPYKYYRKWLHMERLEIILFYLFGFGPILLSFLMWINFLVPLEKDIVAVKVEEVHSMGSGISPADVEFILEDDVFESFPRVRIYDHLEMGAYILEADTLIFHKSRGLLGYDVISFVEFN